MYFQVTGSKQHTFTLMGCMVDYLENQAALTTGGLPALDYGGVSFHFGVATTTAGTEDSTNQTLGKWQSSDTLTWDYVKSSDYISIV